MQKPRNSIVDLWKFIAILMIMTHHLFHIETFVNTEYYGHFSWIYVEFFFMLTGYFTYSHFKRHNYDDNSIFKSGLKYTFHKFKKFVPFTTIAISLQYLITAPFSCLLKGQFKTFLYHFLNYPLEVLLLSEAQHSFKGFNLVPIWFLSAMLLVFPIITTLCQIRNKYLVLIVSGLFSLFYFMHFPIGGSKWPGDLIRALAGMCAGITICIINDTLKDKISCNTKFICIICSISEILCMLFCLVATTLNLYDTEKIIILAFAIGISSMLSGFSISSKLNSKVVSYLGRISMPMFIWHWVIGTIINRLLHFVLVPAPIQLVIYFGGTIILSIISLYLISKGKLLFHKKS